MFQLLNKQNHDVYVEVICCHMSAFDILFENGSSWEHRLQNHSSMNMITYCELMATSMMHLAEWLSDKLSSNGRVIGRILIEFHPDDFTIKSSQSSGYKKNQPPAAIHSQTLAVKNT